MRALDLNRPTIGAQSVGLAQGALDACVAYAKERKQFKKAISEFQGVQFMLADMAMQIEAARALVYECARAGDAGDWKRSEEHTSELQSLMRISYAVFCL